MTDKRFTTNGYYINDIYHDGRKWLVNEVEAEEIVDVMNGLDTKAREGRKAISKLQKENELLRQIMKDIVGATNETYTKNKNIYKVTVVFDDKMYNQIRRCLNG